MKNWKMREIVVMSVISVVFAVIYLVSTHASNIAAGFFGRMSYEPIYGIWFIVSVIAAYIIQKPGAALVSEIIAAFVECLLGNPSGPMVILIGIAQGIRCGSGLFCDTLADLYPARASFIRYGVFCDELHL